MPEPIITPAAATIATATAAVPALTAFGVNLGLRPDVLVAGFAGALVAIVLLHSVPAEGDTWQHLMRATFRRVAVALASSLTAGYITPLALLMANLPDSLLLGVAFAVGAGAQSILRGVIDRIKPLPNGAGGVAK
ncbi:hypothetical protein KBW71_11600 [Hydrogenophaga aromaticivorans]|uniref:hypothetical protein n=1 Tax=Hydrogenophaga aromaticivorans TaxID=2610898 RepID=UPI001B3648F8|nr:hypothetical protein [Hydrogenophaga aromaticivorans]MBQ0919082.1 hypothetical protein [Hydrogenophaga aromaticivorans]